MLSRASQILCPIVFSALLGCAGSQPRFTPSGSGAEGESPSLEGIASFYADEYDGRQTSSGEVYDMNALTAAHRTLAFGTRVRVHNLDNGRTVEVRINDRGPFKGGRIIDVSLEAAKRLGMIGKGTAKVRLEVLP